MELSSRQLEMVEDAGGLLTSPGVDGLTNNNLPKEICLAKNDLYKHFTGIEEFAVSLLRYLADDVDKRLKNIPALPGLTKFLHQYFNSCRLTG